MATMQELNYQYKQYVYSIYWLFITLVRCIKGIIRVRFQQLPNTFESQNPSRARERVVLLYDFHRKLCHRDKLLLKFSLSNPHCIYFVCFAWSPRMFCVVWFDEGCMCGVV